MNMLRIKLFRRKRGVTPTVSAVLMISITVLSMFIVVGSSENVIQARRDQMGEKLFIENVAFNATHIQIYITNIGHGDLTVEHALVNERSYNVVEGTVTLYEGQGQRVSIENYTIDPQGIYRIAFISLHNKDLGVTEVEYP